MELCFGESKASRRTRETLTKMYEKILPKHGDFGTVYKKLSENLGFTSRKGFGVRYLISKFTLLDKFYSEKSGNHLLDLVL